MSSRRGKSNKIVSTSEESNISSCSDSRSESLDSAAIPAKKRNTAKKSTGTRPSSQNSSNDKRAKNMSTSLSGQRKRGRPRKTSNLSSATKQIADLSISNSSSDEEDTRQSSKKGKNSQNNGSAKKQLNFSTSSKNNPNSVPAHRKRGRPPSNSSVPSTQANLSRAGPSSSKKSSPAAPTLNASDDVPAQRKRGRPPLNSSAQSTQANLSRAGPSSSKRTSTVVPTLNASDDSSDDDIIDPTPNARINVMNNFRPSPKKVGTYSPLKRDSLNNSGYMSKEAMKQLVNNCVHYLLIADQKKYVIRKADIKKNVFKDNINVKIYASVIKQAGQTLRQVYGLELMELENQKDQFIIHNNFKMALHFSEFSESKQAERGLIAYLLTVIFMNGNCISEEDLWSSLEPFGIVPLTKKIHPYFGDVKKFITLELVRQMYLEYKRIPNSDPHRHEIRWGVRAKLEVKKKDLLDFACEVYGDRKPESFILQYKDAMQGETNDEEI